MTAAAVATLTSGNEQRYAETAAVLAIAVGAVCVRMASAAWLLADGLWVCDHLRAAGLATRALVLTMYDDDVTVLAALRAGATATHSRSRTGRDRPRRTVAASGEALFGAGIAARMLQHFGRAATSSPSPELTERETEVLGLLAAGPGQRWGREALGSAPRRCITTHPTSSPSCASPTGQEPFSGHETSAWAEPGRAELPLPLVSGSASAIIDDHPTMSAHDVTDSPVVATTARPRAPSLIPPAPRRAGRGGCHGL
jgi:hypothetical protein